MTPVSQTMRLVSPLLKHAVYPALHHTGLLDRITPLGNCAFVNYHGLIPSDHPGGDIFLDGNLLQPAIFRKQLQFLKAHYNLIHPEDFRASIEHAKPLPPRPALVTCDDGLLNSLTDMLPVLQSEGVSCLFFVTAASCGANPGMLWYEELYELMRIQPLSESDSQLLPEEGVEPPPSASFQARWWNTVRRASRLDSGARADWMARVRAHSPHLPDFRSERRWRLLTASGLKQLADAGMTIGAHTLSHPVLSLCTEQESRRNSTEQAGPGTRARAACLGVRLSLRQPLHHGRTRNPPRSGCRLRLRIPQRRTLGQWQRQWHWHW